MSLEKIHIQRKLETGKYIFETHQNNTAMGWITSLKKKQFLDSFSFQSVPLKKTNKKKQHFFCDLTKSNYSKL